MDEKRFDESGIRENTLCLLTNLMLCISLYIAAECLYLTDTGRILAGAVPPAAFLLFEEWALRARPGFALYWGLHAAVFAALLAAAQTAALPVDGVSIAAAAFITALGTWERLRERRIFHPGWAVLLPGLLEFGIGQTMGLTVLMRTGQVTIACAGTLWLLGKSLDGIESALRAVQNGAEVPREQIRRSHLLVTGVSVGLFLGISLPAVLLFSGEFVVRAVQAVLDALFLLLRTFLNFLLSGLNQNEQVQTETETGAQEISYGLGLAGENRDNPLLEAITNVLFAVILILFLILLVRQIARLLGQMYGAFGRTGRMDGDRVEALHPEDNRQTLRRTRPRAEIFPGRTPSSRVRRMYRKLILGGPGADGVKKSHTPRELEQVSLCGADTGEGAQEKARGAAPSRNVSGVPEETRRAALRTVHNLYEKARYSRDGCPQEDAARMKEQIRLL